MMRYVYKAHHNFNHYTVIKWMDIYLMSNKTENSIFFFFKRTIFSLAKHKSKAMLAPLGGSTTYHSGAYS